MAGRRLGALGGSRGIERGVAGSLLGGLAGDGGGEMNEPRIYHYLGDSLTDPRLVGQRCEAVVRADGKCICSRLGTMLVRFGDERNVVLRRRLRKVLNDA